MSHKIGFCCTCLTKSSSEAVPKKFFILFRYQSRVVDEGSIIFGCFQVERAKRYKRERKREKKIQWPKNQFSYFVAPQTDEMLKNFLNFVSERVCVVEWPWRFLKHSVIFLSHQMLRIECNETLESFSIVLLSFLQFTSTKIRRKFFLSLCSTLPYEWKNYNNKKLWWNFLNSWNFILNLTNFAYFHHFPYLDNS